MGNRVNNQSVAFPNRNVAAATALQRHGAVFVKNWTESYVNDKDT